MYFSTGLTIVSTGTAGQTRKMAKWGNRKNCRLPSNRSHCCFRAHPLATPHWRWLRSVPSHPKPALAKRPDSNGRTSLPKTASNEADCADWLSLGCGIALTALS